MKINTEKLYGKMTSKELACLAFSHIARTDEVALKEVITHVPKYTYRIPDMGYQHHLDRIAITVMYWGMMFWKQSAVLGYAYIPELNKNREDDFPIHIRKLKAYVLAMRRLCDAYGISFEAVCQYTGIFIEKDFLKQYQTDEIMVQERYGDLERILTAGDQSFS